MIVVGPALTHQIHHRQERARGERGLIACEKARRRRRHHPHRKLQPRAIWINDRDRAIWVARPADHLELPSEVGMESIVNRDLCTKGTETDGATTRTSTASSPAAASLPTAPTGSPHVGVSSSRSR